MVSLIEACINVFIGFFVSLAMWPLVGALYDIPYTYSSHIGITLIFTVLSIGRGYLVRRFFARDLHTAAVKLARRLNERHTNRV